MCHKSRLRCVAFIAMLIAEGLILLRSKRTAFTNPMWSCMSSVSRSQNPCTPCLHTHQLGRAPLWDAQSPRTCICTLQHLQNRHLQDRMGWKRRGGLLCSSCFSKCLRKMHILQLCNEAQIENGTTLFL